jgi:hypothetical protein
MIGLGEQKRNIDENSNLVHDAWRSRDDDVLN